MKKKRTKRSSQKYPALKKELNLKTRSDLIDYDYLDKLSTKELEWLNQFTTEFVAADFRCPVCKLSDCIDKKHRRKHIHKSKKGRRSCYHNNNARNRCIMTREKASGQLVYSDSKKKTKNDDY